MRIAWLAAGALLSAPLLVGAPALMAAPVDDGLPDRARAQIEALAAAKAVRTAAQRKVESALLTSAQLARGERLPAGVVARPTVRTDRSGRATVDVRGPEEALVAAQVRRAGGVVRSISTGVVRAELPLEEVEAVAASPDVTGIAALAGTPMTSSGSEQGSERGSRAGSVRTEGDVVLGARAARNRLGVSGAGVKVGVLSDGVDSLDDARASGDLPRVRVLPGAAGFGDEGTAMLEIVHDVAPKADLLFAAAIDGEESFASRIRALRAAGADIIVDDILYLGEPAFQDGPIAEAVRDVTDDGALYLSSAGNEGNLDDGTSGNYEADFEPSDRRIGKQAGFAHDFAPGAAVQVVDPVTAGSYGVPVVLQWADPTSGSANDYDVYAVDADGNVVGFSNSTQDGDDDPFEGFYLEADGSVRLAVVKFGGADRYFQLTVFRGRFGDGGPGLATYATAGVTRGHSTVPAALSLAAAPAADPLPFDLEEGDPPHPSGPFPGRFGADQLSERFSSDGPRRIFFDPSGAPLTPGNLTATGGVLRQKPDLTAADGVRTSLEAFDPFFGTSAAAPHAAAVAALMMAGSPGITAAEVRAALVGTALDVERPGPDRTTGAGILQALPALRSVGATAQPYVVPRRLTVLRTTDGDRFLEPGETAVVAVPVTNRGDATAAGVAVRLGTPTAGVATTPQRRLAGDLAAGATARVRFRVTLARGVRLGSRVVLDARVTGGGREPEAGRRTVLVVGQPARRVVHTRYAGPPRAIPDAAGSTAVPLRVRGVGLVSRVRFSVDGTRCRAAGRTRPGIAHSYVSDLVGTLVSPAGTRVTVFTRTGGEGVDLCRVVFTDAAGRAVQQARGEDAPFTGRWRPAEPLARFIGERGNGTWRFRVADRAPDDVGQLRRVTVHLRGFARPRG